MLKSNKGITMTSLVIYVIVLMIVIALMSNFSGVFYKNTNDITIKENTDEQFTRFLAYLTKDINSEEVIFVKTGTREQDQAKYLILKFKDGKEHQYISINNNIYYISIDANKKLILCNNSTGVFTYDNTTKTLATTLNINKNDYTKSFKFNF